MVLGLAPDPSKWVSIYFPVSWLTQVYIYITIFIRFKGCQKPDNCISHLQFGHGLVTTVVGPTQPYLAQKTGVDIGTINLVWTFGFFGYMVTNFIISRVKIINLTMPGLSIMT